jgi:hypothetical protein
LKLRRKSFIVGTDILEMESFNVTGEVVAQGLEVGAVVRGALGGWGATTWLLGGSKDLLSSAKGGFVMMNGELSKLMGRACERWIW